MNKTITTIIVLAALLLGGILLFGSDDNTAQEGTVVFAITDAAANMENISAINMTVSGVDLQTATGAWVAASSDTKTFSLLELNSTGRLALFTQDTFDAGNYEAVRLHVDDVTIQTTSGEESTAVMTSDEVVIDGNVVVNANGTKSESSSDTEAGTSSVVSLDVQADQSLHTTTEGEYVFAPVIEMQAWSDAVVDISEGSEENATVTVSNGEVTSTVMVGVDASGETRTNFMLDSEAGIEITNDGSIELLGESAVELDNGTTSSQDQESNGTGTDVEVGTESTTSVDVGDTADINAESETETNIETGL